MPDWFLEHNIGDISSFIGLIVAIFGFTITIINTFRTKTAALRAEQAVNSVRNSIREVETASDITHLINIMRDVIKLQRSNEWTLIAERYHEIKRILILIKDTHFQSDEDEKKNIQSIIGQIRAMESIVEDIINQRKNTEDIDFDRINKKMLQQIEKLLEILTQIKKTAGESNVV